MLKMGVRKLSKNASLYSIDASQQVLGESEFCTVMCVDFRQLRARSYMNT